MTQHAAPGLDADVRIEAGSLEGFDDGPRIGVWWLPAAREPRGAVLCVQPLCAERAAARHALAAQAWRLAARGWAVLLIDLFGTGDSPGEPGDATIEGWRSDLLRAAMLARQRHAGPNVLWGVRSGALLAADIAVALDQLVDAYVFWAAPASGDAVATMRAEGGSLTPALLAALRELHMQPPPVAEHGTPPAALFVDLVETPTQTAELSSLTCELTETWLEAGYLATPRSAGESLPWLQHPASRTTVVSPAGGLPVGTFMATEEFLEDVK